MKPINQTILTAIIGLMMFSAFIGVYAVERQYKTETITETVFISDSNMNLKENIDYEPDTLIVYGDSYGFGSYKWYGTPPTSFVKNNATSIYLGNNTWGSTMTGFNVETPNYSGAVHHIIIDVPDAKTFIAHNIIINTTLPNQADNQVVIGLGAYNIPQTDLNTGGYTIYSTTTSLNYLNLNYSLNTIQSLGWYSISKNREIPSISIYIYDSLRDGLPTFALELEIEIIGEIITTWSLQDTINVVIGASIAGNIIVIMYMFDSVDFNAVRRDLPGKTRGRGFGASKRKSSKRKR